MPLKHVMLPERGCGVLWCSVVFSGAITTTLLHVTQHSYEIFMERIKENGAQGGRKEGHMLFNDALITFYVRLYGV